MIVKSFNFKYKIFDQEFMNFREIVKASLKDHKFIKKIFLKKLGTSKDKKRFA